MQNNNLNYEKDVRASVETFISLARDFSESGIKKTVEAAIMISDSISKGNTIYCCGNGGSAADSQHIAGEFIGRFLINRKPLPFVSLNTDTSVITCIGNDFGFDQIYSRQIEALGEKGDVLMAFSTSGSSKNIMLAVSAAKKMGLKIISFTGQKDTQLESQSDLCICSGTDETYMAQQIHEIAYHQICKIVEENIFNKNNNSI